MLAGYVYAHNLLAQNLLQGFEQCSSTLSCVDSEADQDSAASCSLNILWLYQREPLWEKFGDGNGNQDGGFTCACQFWLATSWGVGASVAPESGGNG